MAFDDTEYSRRTPAAAADRLMALVESAAGRKRIMVLLDDGEGYELHSFGPAAPVGATEDERQRVADEIATILSAAADIIEAAGVEGADEMRWALTEIIADCHAWADGLAD